MNKILLSYISIFLSSFTLLAQQVDLSSVDAFLDIASSLKEGQTISEKQWQTFDASTAYQPYVERKNPFVIHHVKNTIQLAFSNASSEEKNRILNLTPDEIKRDGALMFQKNLLNNYLDVNNHFEAIQNFRNEYDFETLIEKAKQGLSSFLGQDLDSSIQLKPVYFFFITADGKNNKEALFIDFNLIYKQNETQRINFIAHEFFHNYREHFENHDINYKSDLNYMLDMIQNEGIADMIDKREGYQKYFTEIGESAENIEIWTHLYQQAESDLERLHDLILSYSKAEIKKKEMVDALLKIVKFNGHPIGFFMAQQIVKAGYEAEMMNSFYETYKFYELYNKAAQKQGSFELSEAFMSFLNKITKSSS